jgi:hypothetical protein
MLYNSECADKRWDILRATALQMDAFWNDEVRNILHDYIHHLESTERDSLHEGEVHSGITYADIKMTYKTHAQIRALYLAPESADNVVPESTVNGIGLDRLKINIQCLEIQMSGPISKLKSAVRSGLKIEHKMQKAVNGSLNTARNAGKKFFNLNQASGKKSRGSVPQMKSNNQNNSVAMKLAKRHRGPNKSGKPMTPRFKQIKDGICVSNEETLNSLNGTTAWAVQYNQLINPSNVLMFPWLAGLATKFDKYNIKKLHFKLITRMGTAVTGTAAQGSVQTTIIYDSDDPTPSTYSGLMNTKFAHETVVHNNTMLKYRPEAALFSEYYIAHAGGEQDLTAPGYAVISILGLTGAVTGVYALEVDYEIEFTLPRVSPTAPLGVTGRKFYFANYSYDGIQPINTVGGVCTTTGYPIAVIQNYGLDVWSIYFAGPGTYSIAYTLLWNGVVTTTTLTPATPHANVGPANYSFKAVDAVTSNTIYSGRYTFVVPTANFLWTRNQLIAPTNPDFTMTFSTRSDTAAAMTLDLQIISCGPFVAGGHLLQASVQETQEFREQQLIKDITEKVKQSLKDEVDDEYETCTRTGKTGESVVKVRGYDECYSRSSSSSSSSSNSGSNKK